MDFRSRATTGWCRIAELEIYPDQLDAYKAALKEEISASIGKEPGVLTLYAVSLKGHPEQIRLFETYRNVASYQAHLQSPHFQKYKEQTQHNGQVTQPCRDGRHSAWLEVKLNAALLDQLE